MKDEFVDGPEGGAVMEFVLFEKYKARIRAVLEPGDGAAENAKASIGWAGLRRSPAAAANRPSYRLRHELTVDGRVIPQVVVAL